MLGKNRTWEQVDEWLSAYIDGALSPRERARLEAQLAQDADLRARLESLQQTVALIQGMPPVPAPRNFLLTPAMVRQPESRVRQPAPTARRLAPALTFATAVSGLLCVILLVGNLITAGWGEPGAAAPAPMIAYETGISPQVQETQEALAKKAPSSPDATMLSEPAPLPSEVTPSETVASRMQAWTEEPPSLTEEPPSLIEEGPFPPGIGGGGGAGPEPSLREPDEPEEMETEPPPTPAPEPQPPELVAATAEETTPMTPPVEEVTPTSPPAEMPAAEPAQPFTSWLPVGGLALMTAVLTVLSIRAWRAR